MKPRNVKAKPHTAGIFAALTTVAGVVLSPEVLNILPAKWSAGIALGGVVLQAVTKGVQHGDTVLVDRDEAVAVGFAKPKGEQ